MYFKMFVIDVSIIYENSTNVESKRNFNGTGFHVFYIILFIYIGFHQFHTQNPTTFLEQKPTIQA